MGRFRARPYAKALLQVVLERAPERLEAVAEEVDRLAEAVRAVPDLLRVMTTPALSPARKREVLDLVLDGLRIEEPTRRFVHVLQRHYRLREAGAVAAAYHELVDRHLGRTRAEVEVAGPIEEEVRRRLVEVLGEVTGERVTARFREVPELLAGFRVRIGSRVYDGSARAQLRQLRRAAETVQG